MTQIYSRYVERGQLAILFLFSGTIFCSAFLLFQVQPLIAKFILPWFGSSPGVWTTCMLFFQLLLLLGYGYAHFIVSRLKRRHQVFLHFALLALALISLPIAPESGLKPTGADAPTRQILLILALSVGVPYMLLSASGPLLQDWFARLLPNRSPYRLYALSNAGSLLGLLSYPFLFEPNLAIQHQSGLWSAGYFLFAVLCGSCALLLLRSTSNAEKTEPVEVTKTGHISLVNTAAWFVLSACGSAMLLATTNQLSIDVAVVPFLWILPLSIYLLSFVLCFDSDRWYWRPFYFAVLPMVLLNTVRLLYLGIDLGLTEQIFGYCLTLFVCCMCLHGELARLRPHHSALTWFYLFVSIGGVAGGSFVALFSPAFFTGFYEYPILLCASGGLIGFIAMRSKYPSGPGKARTLLTSVCVIAGFGTILLSLWLAFSSSVWLGSGRSSSTEVLFETWYQQLIIVVAVSVGIIAATAEGVRRWAKCTFNEWWISPRSLMSIGARCVTALGFVVLVTSLVWVSREEERRQIFRDRNFYGVLAIREYDVGTQDHHWGLRDGRISHGEQLKQHRDWPTSYYGPGSGMGLAMRFHPNRTRNDRQFRVGVIGLGAGTIATYANNIIDPELSPADYVKSVQREFPDYMRFYELNPMVEDWAEQKFTFLADARTRGADLDVYMGDARLVLERQLQEHRSQNFDVLVLDAFSSDAIPMHLLTKEALETYWQHLDEHGILALHVSNRYLDIKPVVHRLAIELGKDVIFTKNSDRESRNVSSASWMLMTNNKRFMALDQLRRDERRLPSIGPLWTDDFSSLLDVLKVDD